MMNRFLPVCLLIFTLLIAFSCKSKTVVKRLANQNTSSKLKKSETKKIDGVMYHLPQTIVQVTVPVNKVMQTPGVFVKFAPCFFPEVPSSNVIKIKKSEFSLNPPTFASRGVPDTSETYVIETKGGYFESKTLFVEYAPGSYILQKGESESKNETLEFTVKAIATAAGVASKIAPLMQTTKMSEKDKLELAAKLREEYKCYETIGDAAKPVVAEQYESLRNADPSLKSITATEHPIRDEYQRALATFEKFQELQGQRDEILSGSNNNITSETLKIMLEKNAESIAVYRAAFLGRESEKIWSATFEFTPKKNAAQQNSPMIFSYSEEKGICRNGLVKEKSITIAPGFENAECGKTKQSETQILWLKVDKSTDASHNDFLTRVQNAGVLAETQNKSRGWYYRVPADGTVSLQHAKVSCEQTVGGLNPEYNCSPIFTAISAASGKIKRGGAEVTVALVAEQIGLGNMQIAQLGVVASVPASTAGRSSTTAIALDPATGAMKNYKSSSTALVDKTILDEAGKAANSAVDAADPLNRKKRELEEKKTQNLINEEDKKLSNSSNDDSDN